MPDAAYRFLPWARRGLADRLSDDDGGGALPARGKVSVALTVSSIPEARRDLSLYGPGDVIGVDPKLIVRASPRAGSTDVEPNYFAQIEFDPPDFPWLFTPARAGADDRLRPWCVLVVVDLEVVDPPGTGRGQPLPVLVVPAEAVGGELPDLAESWAWAHAQAVVPAGGVDLPAELAAHPALNVSRIMAPRRLEPGKRYAACLVPAFDAGVTRGLGDIPDPSDDLGPAWTAGSDEVRLPVYFHWEFATGPQGDFEALARRLQPFRAAGSIGVEPMYVGDAGPELPALAPDAPGATLAMDGALRAPKRSTGTLDDVPQELRAALRAALNAAERQASGGADDSPALGPPLYGAFHANRHRIDDDAPSWLQELNLDPRTRAAAGLGAELERANQEQFMQWCWEQVGRILEANRLMSRARLSLEALTRVHDRHVAPLPPDQLFALASPLHARTRVGAVTVSATVARSSLPGAAADPALRRLTSPRRPVLRAALARTSAAARPEVARTQIVARLAAGQLDLDPTRFVPDGLLAARALAGISVPSAGDAPVDLHAAGMPLAAPASLLRDLGAEQAAAAQDPAPRVRTRPDLESTGILVRTGLERVPIRPGDPRGVLHEREIRRGGAVDPLRPREPRDPGDGGELPDRPGRPPRPTRVRELATIRRLQRSLARAAPGGELSPAAPARELVAFDVGLTAETIVARTNPRTTIPLRLSTMLAAGDGRSLLVDAPDAVRVAPTQDRVMAAPELDVSVADLLARLDRTRFLPGVEAIPEEAITLLETNPRFVAALLAGLNTEMNRELLWREFPTDQRGTPFRRFWTWADGFPDIIPMSAWHEELSHNARGGPGGQIALLIRGRLLRRYPNTVVYAWRSGDNGRLVNPPGPGDLELPVFAGTLGDDMAFFGFTLTDVQLTEGDGWFFVLQEQPTEPRFGFDEPARGNGQLPALGSWSDATWAHAGTAPGRYLQIAGNPLDGTVLADVRFADHAGHLAAITLQKPFRVAVHAAGMVEQDEEPHG